MTSRISTHRSRRELRPRSSTLGVRPHLESEVAEASKAGDAYPSLTAVNLAAIPQVNADSPPRPLPETTLQSNGPGAA